MNLKINISMKSCIYTTKLIRINNLLAARAGRRCKVQVEKHRHTHTHTHTQRERHIFFNFIVSGKTRGGRAAEENWQDRGRRHGKAKVTRCGGQKCRKRRRMREGEKEKKRATEKERRKGDRGRKQRGVRENREK